MRFTSRARQLAAVGLAAATVAVVCASATATATVADAGAPAPPTVPPPTVPPSVPVGTASATPAPTTTPVVDDMRTLTIEIPNTWTDVVTAPGTGSDQSPYPQIIASTNINSFQNSFDTSGLMYFAQPLNPDTAAGITTTFDFTGQCTDGGTQPYSDAYFTGTMQTWTTCGGGQAKVIVVFANPADQRFSVVLLVSIVTPADEDALALAQASFFVTKPQGPPASTPGTTTPADTGVAPPPTTAPGGVPTTAGAADNTGDVAIIEDDTGTIAVGVPSTWSNVNTSPAFDDQNQEVPAIAAAPDLDAYRSGQGVGLFMVAPPFVADVQSALPTLAPTGCQSGAVNPYQDEFFTGFSQTFTECNGLTVTVLAVNRNGNTSVSILIAVATTPGDDTPLQTVTSTFDLTPEKR